MENSGRREFLFQVGGLAGAGALSKPDARPPSLIDTTRAQNALILRELAAEVEAERPPAATATNNDESLYPNKIASFSKGLPHSQLGEVNLTSYQLIHSETFRRGKHFDRERAKTRQPRRRFHL